MMAKLTAFKKNVNQNLVCAADLGHYITDALIPYTSDNRWSKQIKGIHSLWERKQITGLFVKKL
jgi:hypothetical protein